MAVSVNIIQNLIFTSFYKKPAAKTGSNRNRLLF